VDRHRGHRPLDRLYLRPDSKLPRQPFQPSPPRTAALMGGSGSNTYAGAAHYGQNTARIAGQRKRDPCRESAHASGVACVRQHGPRDLEREGHSLNNIYRQGWRVGLVRPGYAIAVTFAPPKDGAEGRYVLGMRTVDGHEFRGFQKRCVAASFPERHKYLARYPADFCHLLKPNLMLSNTVTPMQHIPV
jgi:hypothetical protein